MTGETLIPAGFDVSLFGSGRDIAPRFVPVTSQEEALLVKQAEVIGHEFAPYLYSGCQNRAHATYLLLPKELQEKALKVWVLSPGVYSVGFYGLIGLRSDQKGAGDVSWGFHVAVGFLTSERKLLIIDSGVAPGRVLDKEAWFGLMKMPPLTLWTTTKGDVYQFNFIDVDSKQKADAVNPAVWSGHYFEDVPGPNGLNRRQFEQELARDAIGAEALSGLGCEADPGICFRNLIPYSLFWMGQSFLGVNRRFRSTSRNAPGSIN